MCFMHYLYVFVKCCELTPNKQQNNYTMLLFTVKKPPKTCSGEEVEIFSTKGARARRGGRGVKRKKKGKHMFIMC